MPLERLDPDTHRGRPEQLGERRLTISKEGTTAYLKVGFHSPGVTHDDFFPLLVLDAVLTVAKGLNLWASFRTPPPQRSARLYQALVNSGLASAVNGALLPTQEPFLYTLSFTPNEGVSLPMLEEAAFSALEPVAEGAIDDSEVTRGKRQLRARIVFEDDSVTNVAHQLGFFETVVGPGFYSKLQPCIDAVTPDQVRDVAQRRLRRSSLTVGAFQPLETS